MIPVFMHKKYCIVRLAFPVDEASAACLSNFRNQITLTRSRVFGSAGAPRQAQQPWMGVLDCRKESVKTGNDVE